VPAVSTFDAGPLSSWADHAVPLPGVGLTRRGTQFLGGPLGLRGGEISVNVFAPGRAMPFCHRHKDHEEVYLFLSGTGEMLLDGEVIAVKEGTCVRCSPSVSRSWRNTGSTPMAFVVIQYPQRSGVPAGIADGELAEGTWPAE
jgi:quercetin dioxygenase-like cupin family protein